MHIAIGTVDGVTHYSDPTTEQEILDHLAANDFLFGTDIEGNEVFAHTIEDVIEAMDDLFEYRPALNTQTITLMINKHERKFNACHVIWWEFVR